MASLLNRKGRLEDRVAVHPAPKRLGADFGSRSTFRAAAAPASIRHGGARIQARLVTRETAASALVRPTHELQGVFDMPPGSGQFHLALCFKVDGVLGSFRNGPGAVCFQQLTRIVVDFDFSHGVMLLSFCARP
jgi:hypothetical protein